MTALGSGVHAQQRWPLGLHAGSFPKRTWLSGSRPPICACTQKGEGRGAGASVRASNEGAARKEGTVRSACTQPTMPPSRYAVRALRCAALPHLTWEQGARGTSRLWGCGAVVPHSLWPSPPFATTGRHQPSRLQGHVARAVLQGPRCNDNQPTTELTTGTGTPTRCPPPGARAGGRCGSSLPSGSLRCCSSRGCGVVTWLGEEVGR